MMDYLQGAVPPILVESLIESAMLWVLVSAFLRWSRVTQPGMRAIVYTLPLFVPVAVTTLFHVLVPTRPAAFPEFKPFEDFLTGWLPLHFPLYLAFLAMTGIGVAASVLLFFCHVLAWLRVHRAWRRQQHEDTLSHRRCIIALNALACGAGVPVPRLVMVGRRCAGSLALLGPGYIFVPRALAERLDNRELQALLAHELAHVIRKDGLLSFAGRACRNLMLFNPVAHLALRRLESEQEHAADDLATTLGGNRLALASCLLKACRFGACQPGVAGQSLFGAPSLVERRVHRMMQAPPPQPAPRAGWMALGLLCALATLAFAMTV